MTQIELAGEAMRSSIGRMEMTPPALSGCPRCGTVQMIAAPMLSVCEACGDALENRTAQGLTMPRADQAGTSLTRDAV